MIVSDKSYVRGWGKKVRPFLIGEGIASKIYQEQPGRGAELREKIKSEESVSF